MEPAGIVLYGTTWCGDCKRSKQFLAEQRVPYTFVDVDTDLEGLAIVESHNEGKHVIPTIVFPDGSVLLEPSNAELAAQLGIHSVAAKSFYDLVVVGSGPAGLTAALYAAREGISTLVVERAGIGGQAGVTERLDNFPGFPEGVTGAEFAQRLRTQAERFGVEIIASQDVTSIVPEPSCLTVSTSDGGYECFAVLLATGSTYRRLGIPGEEDHIGAGVHFCATCDGPFYRDRDVVVIGGGNSAGEESIFLAKFARRVTIVTKDPAMTASRTIIDKVEAHPQISVITDATPTAFLGDGSFTGLRFSNAAGEERELGADGAFVFIGLSPNSRLVGDLVELDGAGFVVCDVGMQTSVPGIFAAGDVRSGSTKQAASAAGEGAAAALAIRRYVEPLSAGMPSR